MSLTTNTIVAKPTINRIDRRSDKKRFIGAGNLHKDLFYGSAFHDVYDGRDNDDSLYGFDGNDSLRGGNGNDALYGGNHKDSLYGDAGNDLLMGGEGDDLLYGGRGNDTLIGENGGDQLYGEDGNDVLTSGSGRDTVSGGAGNDILNIAGSGEFKGDAGNDRFVIFDHALVKNRKGHLDGGAGIDILDLSNTIKTDSHYKYFFKYGISIDDQYIGDATRSRYYFTYNNLETAILSQFDDSVLLEAKSTFRTVVAGAGKDVFRINGVAHDITIDGGGDHDEYRIEGLGTGSRTIRIKAIQGNDSIILAQNEGNKRTFNLSFSGSDLTIETVEGARKRTIIVEDGKTAYRNGRLSIIEAKDYYTDLESMRALTVEGEKANNTIFWSSPRVYGSDRDDIFHTAEAPSLNYWGTTSIATGGGTDRVYVDGPIDANILDFDPTRDYVIINGYQFGINSNESELRKLVQNAVFSRIGIEIRIPDPDLPSDPSTILFYGHTRQTLAAAISSGHLYMSDTYPT